MDSQKKGRFGRFFHNTPVLTALFGVRRRIAVTPPASVGVLPEQKYTYIRTNMPVRTRDGYTAICLSGDSLFAT